VDVLLPVPDKTLRGCAVDISGTIDLPVSATRLDLPVDATQNDVCRLITLSEQSLDVTPFE
jgi:hypothetical protein